MLSMLFGVVIGGVLAGAALALLAAATDRRLRADRSCTGHGWVRYVGWAGLGALGGGIAAFPTFLFLLYVLIDANPVGTPIRSVSIPLLVGPPALLGLALGAAVALLRPPRTLRRFLAHCAVGAAVGPLYVALSTALSAPFFRPPRP